MIFFLFLIATLTLEQRTDLHLAINDPRSACEELKSAPQGAETERAWIKALSQQGNDGEMLTHWDQIAHAPDLLETVAWGILNCGASSTNPQMRTIALLATAESQDAKYLDILVKGLSDPNRIVRRIAAKLAAHFPDQKVQQALKKQLQREKDGSIRSALIASLTSKEVIQKLLENDSLPPQERQAAISAWLSHHDAVHREEIVKLLQSPKKGLRLLGIRCLTETTCHLALDLLADNVPEVQAAAWQCLGQFQHPAPKKQEKEPLVALSQLFCQTRTDTSCSANDWNPWITHRDPTVRALAASVLSQTGQQGLAAMRDFFLSAEDPFVKLPIAIGLIRLGEQTEGASAFIAHFLQTTSERIALVEKGIFSLYCLAKDVKGPTPEIDDQMGRLELYRLLAITGTAGVEAHLLKMMEKVTEWTLLQVTEVLLYEGDKDSITEVSHLLEHPTQNKRISAALLLALWGEEKAVDVLIRDYPQVTREKKEQILFVLGSVSSKKALPLLTETLHAPSQTLRLLSSLAVLKVLHG